MITARTFFNGKFLGQVAILYVCFFSKIAHSKLTVKTTIMTISIVAMIHVKFSMNFITMFLSCFPITIGTRIIIQGKKSPPFFNGGVSLLGILANHILRGDTRATTRGEDLFSIVSNLSPLGIVWTRLVLPTQATSLIP